MRRIKIRTELGSVNIKEREKFDRPRCRRKDNIGTGNGKVYSCLCTRPEVIWVNGGIAISLLNSTLNGGFSLTPQPLYF
jgi:hypothetical protein